MIEAQIAFDMPLLDELPLWHRQENAILTVCVTKRWLRWEFYRSEGLRLGRHTIFTFGNSTGTQRC